MDEVTKLLGQFPEPAPVESGKPGQEKSGQSLTVVELEDGNVVHLRAHRRRDRKPLQASRQPRRFEAMASTFWCSSSID